MPRKFNRLLILIAITLILLPIYSEAIKIVSWNVLNFPGSTGAAREDDFRKVIEKIDPDILVVQEMLSQEGVNQFLKNVMNYKSKKYRAARFHDGPDTDNSLFYKKSVIKVKSAKQIGTKLRDISEYFLKIKKGQDKGAKFRIYSVHLKAGSGSTEKEKREAEAKILRDIMNKLPSKSLFVVCGDFNFYTSDENAFKALTESQADNDGRVKDPINELGNWHDSKKFSKIHTQSTRTIQFGGGASGGLDDRFDMFLISYELQDNKKLAYVVSSYKVYGNDGKHLNKAINQGKNKAVSKKIANALCEASDHLPVIIELEKPPKQIPRAPSDLSAEASSPTQVDLSWKDNSDNEDGFKIERNEYGSWVQIAKVSANVKGYSDKGLAQWTWYHYRVRAYNSDGNSEYSNEVSEKTPAGPDYIVYRTETGSKYHMGNCQYLYKSKIPITLGDAVAMGLTPCSVCDPPLLRLLVVRH